MLGHVLDQLLRLLHPVIPFVTDELWSRADRRARRSVRGAWPAAGPVLCGRRGRGRAGRAAAGGDRGAPVPLGPGPAARPAGGDPAGRPGRPGWRAHEPLIRSLARLDEPGDGFAATATLSVAGGVSVELDTRGAIDVAAERARLDKDRAAAEKEAAQCRAKLGNPAFTDKAPDDVVAKIRERLAAAEADLAADRRRAPGSTCRHDAVGRPTQPTRTRGRGGAAGARGYTRMVFDLGRIEALLDLLGSPQRAYPAIHLTGTNGKTSTARMIDSLLRAHGLRTGPVHQPAPGDRPGADQPSTASRSARSGSSRSTSEVAPVAAASSTSRTPRTSLTYFDVTTAMALAAFADAPVDVAVVEVGLGGAEDSTNVLQANTCVITPIGLDHTEWLGDTVEEIAAAKAGIIHSGATVICAAQPDEALRPILERCAEVGATDRPGGRASSACSTASVAVGGQVLTLQGLGGVYEDVFLPLHGAHQAQNAARGAGRGRGVPGRRRGDRQLDPDIGPARASRRRRSPGRLERVRSAPTILLDAAHNPHGMAATVAALSEEFAFSRLIAVVAVLADKDVDGMLELLEPVVDAIVVHPQHLAPGHVGRPAGRDRRGGLRRRTGSASSRDLPDAIEAAVDPGRDRRATASSPGSAS